MHHHLSRLAVGLLIGAGAVAAADEPSKPSTPVARVCGHEISLAVLEADVASVLNRQFYHGTVSEDRRLELEKERLAVLVDRILDMCGGLANGMELPMEEAERRRSTTEEEMGKEAYEGMLTHYGATWEQHALRIAEGLLADRAHRRFVTDPAAVSDDELRIFYEADPEMWVEPEAIRVGHIILKVAAGASDQKVQQRKQEALALRARIEKGEDFADVAAAESDGQYRIKGGDLGWVHRGRLVEPLETAAWKADLGALLGPLRSIEGWHLLRVHERREKRRMTRDEVLPMARKMLEEKRLTETEEAWYGRLRAEHEIEILDERLAD